MSADLSQMTPEEVSTWLEEVRTREPVERERFDVIRRGPRQPVSLWIRRLILQRDQHTCQICRTRRVNRFELDHVIPWSAGGPDHSTNLRTTCIPCNQERSNYKRGDESTAIYLPVMQDCLGCQSYRPERHGVERVEVFCGNHDSNGWAYADETRW